MVNRLWVYVGLGGIVIMSSAYGFGWYNGYQSATQKIEYKTLTKTVTIQEKHREIRARRPDTNGVIDRLQKHTF